LQFGVSSDLRGISHTCDVMTEPHAFIQVDSFSLVYLALVCQHNIIQQI